MENPKKTNSVYLVIQFVTFLGWWKRDPFKALSDLQLGDEKGTLNHLGKNYWEFPKMVGFPPNSSIKK